MQEPTHNFKLGSKIYDFMLEHSQKNLETLYRDNPSMLRYDPGVRKAVDQFWKISPKDENGHLQKKQFFEIWGRFGKLLAPDLSLQRLEGEIETEFYKHSLGKEFLDQECFYEFIFQIAEVHVLDVTSESYIQFF